MSNERKYPLQPGMVEFETRQKISEIEVVNKTTAQESVVVELHKKHLELDRRIGDENE